IEDGGNGCMKVTVSPGVTDRFGLEFYYVTGVYRRSDDGQEWIWDYTGFGNCIFELEYKPSPDISRASISGISMSYGYTGKAYTPAFKVVLDGKVLEEGADYSYKFRNNRNPGTATITITGRGEYIGTRVKKFEIVDCVSEPIDGGTYQLIPKNNTKTAVCSFSGKMVNNTRVYITDRSSSEAMKFVAEKQKGGSWKFINAKCELALAVQPGSATTGKGLVLYSQTARQDQAWKLSRKSDYSFAIHNAASGLSIAMSDVSPVKGTALSMAEPAGTGLQRFYLVETDPVANTYSGTYAVQASGNRDFVLGVRSSSKKDGANVNLRRYEKSNAQKYQLRYSGGGYYRMENANSGLVVTVKGNTKADGTNVIQSAWEAESGQRWKVIKNPDGTVSFMNALGTVLHLSGNKTANDTNVVAKKAAATGA
ncbi:MAG: RICIN domain-containing protein, partial [Lachnospiraceae bacterium]|nr:RICIN domain-containing protein [Lachnospiraceae bacterium]